MIRLHYHSLGLFVFDHDDANRAHPYLAGIYRSLELFLGWEF
jgi:hypothetical protein